MAKYESSGAERLPSFQSRSRLFHVEIQSQMPLFSIAFTPIRDVNDRSYGDLY